jgi:hypothetical protein
MALTKTVVEDSVEAIEIGDVQVRTKTAVLEDGVEISRSYHRKVISPGTLNEATDALIDTDISSESALVQAVCNAAWTDAVRASYLELLRSQA